MLVARAVGSPVESLPPSAARLNPADSAQYVIDGPLYLDERGHLWATHPEGVELADLLESLAASTGDTPRADPAERVVQETVRVVRETVRLVGWREVRRRLTPVVVAEAEGRVGLYASGRRVPLDLAGARWPEATWTGRHILVPVGRSLAAIDPDAPSPTLSPPLAAEGSQWAAAWARDTRGVLSWALSEGGLGAVRWVDGRWTRLGPDENWPARILTLIPLLDGSVLVVAAGEEGKATLRRVSLEAMEVDARQVEELVVALSADEQSVRDEAYARLGRFGPASWPTLERIAPDQPAEARLRIRQLLAERLAPTLGGFRPVNGRLRVASRSADGSMVLVAPEGVEVSRGDGQVERFEPAWLLVEPDEPVRLVHSSITRQLDPDGPRLSFLDGRALLDDPGGLRIFDGATFRRLARKPHAADFREPVGIDRAGRWILAGQRGHLVIDPNIADPRPRLATWKIAGEVGWTDDDWPAMRRGAVWSLRETGWRALGEEASLRRAPRIGDTGGGSWRLDSARGLIVAPRAEGQTQYALPREAGPFEAACLIEAGGRLYLVAESRVVRLRVAEGRIEVEAVFTPDLPPMGDVARVWKDPAGRVVLAGREAMWILFVAGAPPRELADLMPVDDDEDD